MVWVRHTLSSVIIISHKTLLMFHIAPTTQPLFPSKPKSKGKAKDPAPSRKRQRTDDPSSDSDVSVCMETPTRKRSKTAAVLKPPSRPHSRSSKNLPTLHEEAEDDEGKDKRHRKSKDSRKQMPRTYHVWLMPQSNLAQAFQNPKSKPTRKRHRPKRRARSLSPVMAMTKATQMNIPVPKCEHRQPEPRQKHVG